MADEETTPTPAPTEEPATPPATDATSSGEPKQEASPAPTEPEAVVSESVASPPAESETAQIPLSEPLSPEPEPIPATTASAPSSGESTPEPPPVAASAPVSGQATKSADSSAPITTGNSRDMFVKARAVIQVRKHEKLDKIMEALEGKDPTTLKLRRAGEITNDEVEKLLHVSDATATRYLSALEKDGKIKQVGKTGMAVVYTKI